MNFHDSIVTQPVYLGCTPRSHTLSSICKIRMYSRSSRVLISLSDDIGFASSRYALSQLSDFWTNVHAFVATVIAAKEKNAMQAGPQLAGLRNTSLVETRRKQKKMPVLSNRIFNSNNFYVIKYHMWTWYRTLIGICRSVKLTKKFTRLRFFLLLYATFQQVNEYFW